MQWKLKILKNYDRMKNCPLIIIRPHPAEDIDAWFDFSKELTNIKVIYEGEITEYRVSPMTATSDLTASQNRLSVSVNVRFLNLKKEDDNFERKFSFYFDYPAETQLLNIKSEAHDLIFERITQDIFNASLAKW